MTVIKRKRTRWTNEWDSSSGICLQVNKQKTSSNVEMQLFYSFATLFYCRLQPTCNATHGGWTTGKRIKGRRTRGRVKWHAKETTTSSVGPFSAVQWMQNESSYLGNYTSGEQQLCSSVGSPEVAQREKKTRSSPLRASQIIIKECNGISFLIVHSIWNVDDEEEEVEQEHDTLRWREREEAFDLDIVLLSFTHFHLFLSLFVLWSRYLPLNATHWMQSLNTYYPAMPSTSWWWREEWMNEWLNGWSRRRETGKNWMITWGRSGKKNE